jgi:hypothetical protein
MPKLRQTGEIGPASELKQSASFKLVEGTLEALCRHLGNGMSIMLTQTPLKIGHRWLSNRHDSPAHKLDAKIVYNKPGACHE